ncbi:PRC-barrel domain-containing protein [Azospirillum doebereinerae]
MKSSRSILTGVALAAAVLAVQTPWPVLSQAVALVVVDVKAVAAGYRASKLTGTSVVNEKNEKIGSLDDIIIGRDKVLFAVLEVGGFLGIGAHLVAVPFSDLQLDETGKKISLPGASKDELKKLPEFKYVG